MPRLLQSVTALAYAGALALPLQAQIPVEEQFDPRGFSIYDTQAAKALARSALAHLAANRIAEAYVELQSLIEDHAGELLGGTRPSVAGGVSHQDVHPGASDYATRRLFELPAEGREAYRERYSDRAAQALETALESSDRAALAAIARRWPLTAAAERAWWALGDIEIELGNTRAGILAWKRALARSLDRYELTLATEQDWRAAIARLEERYTDAPQGARGLRARVEFALRALAERSTERLENAGGGNALAPPLVGSDLPGRSPDTWQESFELPPHPFRRSRHSAPHYSFFPVRWADVVLLSTSIEVLGIGAYTGELIWRSGEDHTGWSRLKESARDDFRDAVDLANALIAPAVSRGICVAALQIPHVFENKADYGDLSIIRQIPNRRLFAFDARTGEPLWNTMPPADWNGESGSFADRMRIVGPPVIEGSRVLVPAARLRGRIEYHVGCFDLYTGEELWSTALITGQRALNMFGRTVTEFSAPPLRVVDNQVIALTQLGTLAAVDLFSGDTLWEVLYEQLPIERSRYSRPGRLNSVWKNAPPAIAGDVIVATPSDSAQLLAVNRHNGAMIWFMDRNDLNRKQRDASVNLLVGADDQHVYLSGNRVLAFEAPRGLAKSAPIRRDWAFPASTTLTLGYGPRPVMTDEHLLVPDSSALFVVDRNTGKRHEEIGWGSGGHGNLLTTSGALFTVDRQSLSGYFNWEQLVDRARADVRANPDDVNSGLSLAKLLEKRGVTEWYKGETRAARRHLSDARSVIDQLMRSDSNATDPLIRNEHHSILRSEARILRDLAAVDEALPLLRRARQLAPTREALRDTLLEEQALLRGRSSAEWLQALELLLAECAELPVWCEQRGEPGDVTRLTPVDHQTPGSYEDLTRLPIGLWVLIVRSEHFRETQNAPAEFADLHAILARYGREAIAKTSARSFAAGRIGVRLRAGEREGYQPFEDQARELYENAVEQGDTAALKRVPELYPHSAAANVSNDARLSLALSAGAMETVASIVLSELPENWNQRTATERDLGHLMRLASALGDGGNIELRAGLANKLAKTWPDIIVGLEERADATITQLAEAWNADLSDLTLQTGETASFNHELRLENDLAGRFEPLGRVPQARGQMGTTTVFAEAQRIVAFSSQDPSQHSWKAFLNAGEAETVWRNRFAAVPGLALLATSRRVVAFDRETGDEVWSWRSEANEVKTLRAAQGVVVAVEDLHPEDRSRSSEYLVVGLDAQSGIELWRLLMNPAAYHMLNPTVGDGYVTFLPQANYLSAEVRDLFTGRPVSSFKVPRVHNRPAEGSWIEDGRVIIPRFMAASQPDLNHIVAFDLETGSELWKVDFTKGHLAGRELQQVIREAGRTYLLMVPINSTSNRAGGIYELVTRSGAVSSAPIVTLRESDTIVGLGPGRNELDSPFMFVLAEPRVGDRYSVQAIQLPYGPRWRATLPLSGEGLHSGRMPVPAVSDTTVGIAWIEYRAANRGPHWEMALLDRSNGRLKDSRVLGEKLANRSTNLRLVTIGDALVLCGQRLEVMR